MKDKDNLTTNIKRKQKKKNHGIKFFLTMLIIVAIIAGGVFGCMRVYRYGISLLSNFNYVKIDKRQLDIDKDVAEELGNFRNIIILGVDAREGENPDRTRSDAIIIATINEDTKEVTLTSTLRDSYLVLDEVGNQRLDKLTHAHAYGGPENTIRALNRNLDLNATEFMAVNWKTVAKVADAMGGIRMNIKDYEVDEMNRYIADTNRNLHGSKKMIKRTGWQTLNGIQTVTYCRIRHVGNGDNERALRMRRTIKAIIKKTKKMSLKELEAVAKKTLPDIKTNITAKEMFWLLMDAPKYKIESGGAFPYKMRGTKLNGIWYDVPTTLEANVRAFHEKVFHQKKYKPTDRVLNISQQIIDETGVDTPEL